MSAAHPVRDPRRNPTGETMTSTWPLPRPFLRLLPLCLVVAIGGCSQPMPAARDWHGSGPLQIAPERSIVVLPASYAEKRLAVRQEIQGDLLMERTILANNTAEAGENEIVVRTQWRGTSFLHLLRGRFDNPYSETTISQRIAEEFPPDAVVSAPQDRVNRHGPYRYVTATHGEVLCVLAWQLLDTQASITGEVHTYAVDLRLCDSARDADDLITLFDQIDLTPYL